MLYRNYCPNCGSRMTLYTNGVWSCENCKYFGLDSELEVPRVETTMVAKVRVQRVQFVDVYVEIKSSKEDYTQLALDLISDCENDELGPVGKWTGSLEGTYPGDITQEELETAKQSGWFIDSLD